MSKVTNFAPLREWTLLSRSFRRSRGAVLVPTSPGYLMFWPAMVMQVRLGSDFSGRNVKTTFEKAIPFCRSKGVSLQQIAWKVMVTFTRYLAGLYRSTPMPWNRRPSSLEYDVFQSGPIRGLRRSAQCSKDWPVSGSRTVRDSGDH